MQSFNKNVFFIAVLFYILQILHTAKGFYIKPVYEYIGRDKRAHTTVCVQIKPIGTENHEPYYMCRGHEFPQTQTYMPPNLVNPIDENYANFDYKKPVNTADAAEYTHQPQNLHFGNAYQHQPQFPQMFKNNAETSHAVFQTPSSDYAKHEHNPNQYPAYPQNNNQHMLLPQTLHFGNPYQQQTPLPHLVKPNEESKNGHIQTLLPLEMIQHPTANDANYQQNSAPSMPSHSDFSAVNPTLMPTEMYQYPSSENANNQHNPAPLMPPSLEFSGVHPTNYRAHLQNNNENIQPPNSGSSKTDSLANSETDQDNEIKPAKKEDVERKNGNATELTSQAFKHNINPEQFNALLEEEVLGTPNLAFTHDEIIPIQNMYTEPKAETPMMSQGHNIPIEYLNDPILRAFYNIDHYPTDNIEKFYSSPTIEENNSVLQPSSMPIQNIQGCTNLQTPVMIPEYKPPPGKLINSMVSNKCYERPFTFQPIIIAIPWLSTPYNNLLTNIQPGSCGEHKIDTSTYDHSQSYLNKEFYRSKSRENDENTSFEDSSNKNSSTTPEVNNSSQTKSISTKTSDSSEEDLFVEDTTTKAGKEVKIDDEESNKQDDINTSSTSIPHTTVRTFKTMLHAAKVAAKQYYHPRNPPTPIKRHIPHMYSSAYPSSYKRQYVRQLEKNHN